MSQLSFDKDELITLRNGIEYLPNSVNLSKNYREKCENIIAKIDYMIDHIDRQEKTVQKFAEWNKSISEQKNEM